MTETRRERLQAIIALGVERIRAREECKVLFDRLQEGDPDAWRGFSSLAEVAAYIEDNMATYAPRVGGTDALIEILATLKHLDHRTAGMRPRPWPCRGRLFEVSQRVRHE